SFTEECGHGTYYTYTVTTAVGTQEAVDPYAKAAGLNGNRGMVVDLDKTNPNGWTDVDFDPTFGGTVNFDSYSDAFIWEIHVRDFSNMLESSQYKGKYLAFTETGRTNANGLPAGVDYIKNLGVTHVHLLPSYDYATVKEENPESGFNWGYDPKYYNVPEGSYSTNPYDGEVRINEYKQMVQALHNQGIGVIMDVVYNHTFSATDSNFHRIVPYYYYRYNANGANQNASGCGNDTASERYMYRKYMVDSLTYWITEYNLDGFRFDLMGLHDLETMRLVEEAVHAVNPNAIIYGEGWTMGSTTDGSEQANQTNIGKITPTNTAIGSIAVFNDAIRNGLKGNSGFGEITSGILNGGANSDNLNKVLFGILGGNASGAGWRVSNNMVINYMSAHDNLALWDQLTLTMGGSTTAKAKANRLGAAILFVSKGTPFVQAGEEMLRTKPFYDKEGNLVPGEYDENSYSSCDETNNLKWNTLTATSEEYKMVQYYAGLVAMRKAYPIFSDVATNIQSSSLGNCGLALQYTLGNQKAIVLINASGSNESFSMPSGSWKLVATVDKAGATSQATQGAGNVSVPAGGILVYVQ
ncbi:MAG: type I pullulanase, partial [Clostridia bacterium]|nr:type I pullulanase [Clostridia bacterium]